MTAEPYQASEDSALLSRAVSGFRGDSCLEMGAGNGGTLVDLSGRFRLAVGTDIIRPGMSDWKGAGADYLLADGASCLRSRSFDLVAFNPPYLAGAVEDVAVDGGDRLEVPLRFLKEALRVVKDSGSVVFLLNDSAGIGEIEALCFGRGFRIRRIDSERVFFEELTVFLATRG